MSPPDPTHPGVFHYAGVGGSGMSALAQFQVMLGGHASGSDRSFDQGGRDQARVQLERLGIALFPQDGSGPSAPECAALVVSTAVEDGVPDVRVAKERGLPILHRSELLAQFVAMHRTLAVSGTSGKSTVVAMAFELLRGAGKDPSVITGGDLEALRAEGLWGNAWRGGDLLVIEADESDGSLVRYEPAVAVVLNLQKDHKTESEVLAMFETFAARAREALVVGEGENLASVVAGARARRLPVVSFGFGASAHVRPDDGSLDLGARGSTFAVRGTRFTLPAPGRHNVENALAALAACGVVGVPLAELVAPLAAFRGVGRRFQTVGVANGVEVIDDFAHNPAKIEATLATARRLAGTDGRVLAVYQPHGYGPTRFLRADFVDSFARALGPQDRAWWLEVFYAGGTTTKDFSSADIVADIAARGAGARAAFAASREELVAALAKDARPGDLVIVMGARDPSLTGLARRILEAIAAETA
ncbi:MAG: Mur ligase family protein [Candidatus Eisenbacteria bacterium]